MAISLTNFLLIKSVIQFKYKSAIKFSKKLRKKIMICRQKLFHIKKSKKKLYSRKIKRKIYTFDKNVLLHIESI